MKFKFLLTAALLCFLVLRAFSQDVSINILGLQPNTPLGLNGIIQVDICNNDGGNTNLELNKIRPTIEFPSELVGTSVVPISNEGFIVFSNDGVTIVFENIETIVPGDCAQILIGFTGEEPGGPSIVTGTIVFIGGPTDGNLPGNDISLTSITVVEEPAPVISVTKTADTLIYGQIGDVINYEIVVSNDGNVDLFDVEVVDDLTGDQFILDTLLVGQSDTFTVFYVVQQIDIDNQFIQNIVTATAIDELDTMVEDSDMEQVNLDPDAFNPMLSTSKIADVLFFEAVGDIINYTIDVTNSGNVTLYNVMVVDDLTGDMFSIDTLSVGQSESFLVSYTITQMDMDNGIVTNIATTTAEDPNGDPVEDTAEEEVPLDPNAFNPMLNTSKTADVMFFEAVGDVITYEIEVINSGNVTLYNVEVVDDLTGDVFNLDTLMVGQTVSFMVSYTVTQTDMDAGIVMNIATTTAEDPNGDPVEDTAEEEVPLDPNAFNPMISSTKIAEVMFFMNVDEVINYTIEVTNSGNVTLYNVMIVDDLTGDMFSIDTLMVGQSESFMVSYTVTQMDFDNGIVNNIATITAEDPNGDPVEDTAEEEVPLNPDNFFPMITSSKTADVVFYQAVGDIINYTIEVTNSGNVTLFNVEVVDDLTGDTFMVPTLMVGQTETFMVSYTVTQADMDNGSIMNIATITAEEPNGDPVDDTAEEEVPLDPSAFNPELTTEKTADIMFYEAVGDIINYDIDVTNTGNVTLFNVVVVDDLTGDMFTLDTLMVGEMVTFSVSYTVTQMDMDNGIVMNIATITAQDPNGDPIDDTAEEEVPLDPNAFNPELTTEKTADVVFFEAVGDIINYTIDVTNSGNVTLYNVEVVDDLTGDMFSFDTLMVGQTVTFMVNYTVNQMDMDNGLITNIVTVIAEDPNGDPIDDMDEEDVPLDPDAFNPMLTTEKVADVLTYENVGDVITYTINVSNSGNITLYNVVVIDDLTGDMFSIDTLMVGQMETFMVTYTVNQQDIDNGSITNIVTVTAEDPDGDDIEDMDEEEVDANQIIDLIITKVANVEFYTFEGQEIEYTITVQNNGNVNLFNIEISDPLIDFVFTQDTLAPGEILVFTESYFVTADDLNNVSIINVANITAENPSGDEIEESADEEVFNGIEGSVSITKEADAMSYNMVGQVVNYTLTIENTGVTQLFDVEVSDPLTGFNATIPTLQPGEMEVFMTSYTVQLSDLIAGEITNIAVVEAMDFLGNSVIDSDTLTIIGELCVSPPMWVGTLPPSITVNCDDVPAPAILMAENDCDDITIEFEEVRIDGNCPNNYTLIRTWTATTLSGLSITHVQTLTVIDDQGPIITITHPLFSNIIGGILEIECNANDESWIFPNLTEADVLAIDNCGTATVAINSDFEISQSCKTSGFLLEQFYTITAEDDCGNITVFEFILRLVDNTPPIIIGIPNDTIVNCQNIPLPPQMGECDSQELSLIIATDNCECATLIFEEILSNQTCEYNFDILRRWTATDNCGNVTIEEQLIRVRDQVGPEIVLLNPNLNGIENGSTIQIECENGNEPEWLLELNELSVDAVDQCSGSTEINFLKELDLEGGLDCAVTGHIGMWLYKWSTNDECGNASEFSFVVRLMDSQGPAISGPDITCISDPELSGLIIEDNCSAIVNLEFEDVTIPGDCGGTDIMRTWLAVDACNNFTFFEQRILGDNTNTIEFEFSGNELYDEISNGTIISLECGQEHFVDAYREVNVNASSDCIDELNVLFDEIEFEDINCTGGFVKTITLSWSALDDCGNIGSFDVLFTFADTKAPSFFGNARELKLECGDEILDPLVIDGCSSFDLVLMSVDTLESTCINDLTLMQIFRASDLCGNSSDFERMVYIEDTTGPELISGDPAGCFDELNPPTFIDYCGDGSGLLRFEDSSVIDDCGTYTSFERTWIASDVCGNETEFVQVILLTKEIGEVQIVNDFIGEIKHGETYFLECSQEFNSVLEVFTKDDVVNAPNCDALSIGVNVQVAESSDCSGSGVYLKYRVTYSISSPCGTNLNVVADVVLRDTQAPVFVFAPQNKEVSCLQESTFEEPIIEEGCSSFTLDYNEQIYTNGGLNDAQVIVRRWVATDECGNSSNHAQTIFVYFNELDAEIVLLNEPVCNTDENMATVIVPPFTFGLQYEWIVLNGECEILSGQNTQTIRYRIGFSPVRLQVRITDREGCITIREISFVCSSIIFQSQGPQMGINTAEELFLYPNPTRYDMTMEWEAMKDGDVEIKIITINGVELETIAAEQKKGFNKTQIKSSDLLHGVYIIELKDDEGSKVKKFVKIE